MKVCFRIEYTVHLFVVGSNSAFKTVLEIFGRQFSRTLLYSKISERLLLIISQFETFLSGILFSNSAKSLRPDSCSD